jgi:hypothetical protein
MAFCAPIANIDATRIADKAATANVT